MPKMHKTKSKSEEKEKMNKLRSHRIKELALCFYHQGIGFIEMMNFTNTPEGERIIKEMEVKKK